MKKLLFPFLLLLLITSIANGQSVNPPIRKVTALTATCVSEGAVTSSNPVVYRGSVYKCVAGAWVATGAGSGTVSGTSGNLGGFSGSNTIGNAPATFSGTTITVVGRLSLTNVAVTATSGGTTTLDLSTGNIRTITMPAGNTTLALSNVPVGLISIAVVQDGTGSRTITFPATMKNGTSTLALQPSTAANARTQYGFQCDGTNCQLTSYQLDGNSPATFLTGTASLDFGATAAGACDSLTITVTGAIDGDVVTLGIPNALQTSSTYQSFQGFVSAAGVVTVKRCNLTNTITSLSNPAPATVRAVVIQY